VLLERGTSKAPSLVMRRISAKVLVQHPKYAHCTLGIHPMYAGL
jgi:hypothetical protein